jgi:hypothetical protein
MHRRSLRVIGLSVLRASLAFPAMLALLCLSSRAAADGNPEAREAYDRGTAAHHRKDFAEAATDFALADALSPSDVALRAALDDAVLADDPALGMALVERSGRAPVQGALSETVAIARERFRGRAGRVAIHCPPSHRCLATLDGHTVDTAKAAWATSGQHTLLVQVDDAAQPRLIEIKPDETLDVTPALGPTSTPPVDAVPVPALVPLPAAPQTVPPVVEGRRTGLSPVWFWLGTGATALSGGATLASGLDTLSKHQSFVDARCPVAGSSACNTLSTSGTSAQTRTDVLVGVTAAVGVATVVVLLFTRWGSGEDARAHPSLSLGTAGGLIEF